MKSKLIVITFIFVGCGFFANAQNTKLKKVFNGKNLKGWVVPENNIWWNANDGVMSAKSDPTKTGSILWTDKDYDNFVVVTDFKFGEGTVDSGIFLRTDKQQIQIGISGSLKRDMTGSPYIPGKGYPVEAENIARLLKMEGWNTMKVQAVNKVYKVWLNGEQVLEYESENAIDKGPIGFQLHPGKDMAIDFRNIKIGEI